MIIFAIDSTGSRCCIQRSAKPSVVWHKNTIWSNTAPNGALQMRMSRLCTYSKQKRKTQKNWLGRQN